MVAPPSCLLCFDSGALLSLNEPQLYLFGQIRTGQTGVQSKYISLSPMVSVLWGTQTSDHSGKVIKI